MISSLPAQLRGHCTELAWAVLLAMVFAAPAPALSSTPAKPNVLLIVADDLNNRLGCYGHSAIQSPNIDRLAQRSVRFDRAYCQFPFCAPSRTSFLSGRRIETLKVFNNHVPPPEVLARLKDIVYLPEQFHRRGYFTARIGKVGDGATVGRSEPLGRKLWALSQGPDGSGGGRGPDPVAGDGADLPDAQTARQVVALLEAKRDRPFFIAAGFLRPHEPFRVPQKHFDLYPPEKVVLPKGTRKGDATEEEMRRYIAGYHASISFLDAQVGLLLDALDRGRLWDSTIVVFFSDHGYQLGEHNRWSKPHPFEETCRVPLLVAVPGKPGDSSPRLVELVDLYPTLLQLCGLPLPDGLEGISLVPLLDAPQRPWKKAAFTTIGKTGTVSVRTERYRYIEEGPKRSRLYDHDADPQENTNVIDDPRHTKALAEIRQLLQAGWRAALPAGGQ